MSQLNDFTTAEANRLMHIQPLEVGELISRRTFFRVFGTFGYVAIQNKGKLRIQMRWMKRQ